MNRKNIFSTLLFIIIMGCLSFIYAHKKSINNFTCQGQVNSFKGDVSYRARDQYTFSNGNGEIQTIGVYIDKNQKKEISYDIKFKYDRIGDEFNMLSTYSSLNSADANLLNDVVPDFYLYKDRGFRMIVSLYERKIYVFSTLGVPFILCINNDYGTKPRKGTLK